MRYECPRCGLRGADNKRTRKIYKCHGENCDTEMVLLTETPFEIWWQREGVIRLEKDYANHKMELKASHIFIVHDIMRIAWYNGAYNERQYKPTKIYFGTSLDDL